MKQRDRRAPRAPRRDVHGEPQPKLRGAMHLAGVFVSLWDFRSLLSSAQTDEGQVAAWFHGAGTVGLFVVSGGYHALPWSPRWKRRWRAADHAMIFVHVAMTYVAFGALAPPGSFGGMITKPALVGAVVLSVVRLRWLEHERLDYLYLAFAWFLGCTALITVWDQIGAGAWYVIAAGALYTGGKTVKAKRGLNRWPEWFGYHEAWHLLVSAAEVCLWIAMARFILPPI